MASIRADMQLNAAPFLDGIARVQSQMRNLQASVAGITGVFFAARAALSGFTGVLNQMRGTLDLGGKLSDLAASTGVAAGEMLVLQRAFQDNGLGAEEAGTMLNRMQRAIIEAGQGSATYARAFETLGISLSQLASLTPEQQLRTIGQAIASIKDPAESTAASMQIFGRAGGRLQTLFENFDGAVGDARTAVGGLADVMDGNAASFDFISDAIAGAGQKLQQFFAGFLSETIDTEPFEALNRLDLTGLGQSAGDIVNQIGEMVGAFRNAVPAIGGVAAGLIALRTGLSASVIAGFSSGLSGLGATLSATGARFQVVGAAAKTVFTQMAADVRLASAQAQIGFTGMTASARGAAAGIRASFSTTFRQIGLEARVAASMTRAGFMSMVGAAKVAGAGMKAALVSTGIGAVIVGIGMAIEAVMAKIGAANEASRAMRREGGDMSRAGNANVGAIKNIGNTDEQASMLENLDEQIANVRERLGNISEEYDSDEAIAAASEQLERHIAMLERQKQTVANISPEYMAQVAAIRAQEEALAAAKAQAAELAKEVDRALQTRDAEGEKRILSELSPQDAEQRVLSQVAAPDKAAELVLSVTGLPDIKAAQSALEAINSRAEAEAQLRTVGLPNAAEMIKTLDAASGKTVELALEATGLPDANALRAAIDASDDKNIQLALEATGLSFVGELRAALDGVPDKTITMALAATGAASIEELRVRLDAAPDEKTVEMILRATGTEDLDAARAKLAELQNSETIELALEATGATSALELEQAIAAADSKTITLALEATGLENVEQLKAALAAVGDTDITITTEGVTAEIERLRALGAEITDAEKARLVELIEAEKTLLAIKERQTQEDEKRAEQAARLSDMQASMALEAERAVAEAMGDKDAVRAIQVEEKARQIAKSLEAQGMDPNEAADLARQKAELLQLTNEIGGQGEQQIARGDAQRSIGLGGSAGLGPNLDAQREMVKKQEIANTKLGELITALNKRTPVMLAEVFD
jgi:hypothetical protein